MSEDRELFDRREYRDVRAPTRPGEYVPSGRMVHCTVCDAWIKDNSLARSAHGKMHVRKGEAREGTTRHHRQAFYLDSPDERAERERRRTQYQRSLAVEADVARATAPLRPAYDAAKAEYLSACAALVDAAERGGPYADLESLATRVQQTSLAKQEARRRILDAGQVATREARARFETVTA